MQTARPLSDRVLICLDPATELSPGGILIPTTVEDMQNKGLVIAVGPGRLLDSGERVPVEVDVGDHVLFGKYSGRDVQGPDNPEVLIMREEDILAVLED